MFCPRSSQAGAIVVCDWIINGLIVGAQVGWVRDVARKCILMVFVELKALEHVCGITAIGELICYGAQDVSSDPFGYGERQNEQGELLRALVRCDGEQCVAAETYATLDLSGRFSDAFIAEGCAIRSDGRPHCFGLYSTHRSCGEYDATQADLESACFERIF